MPEWLLTLLIGGVIMGLVGLIYNYQTQKIKDLEKWKEKRPSMDELLTETKHAIICRANMRDLKQDTLQPRFEHEDERWWTLGENIKTIMSDMVDVRKDIGDFKEKFYEYLRNNGKKP